MTAPDETWDDLEARDETWDDLEARGATWGEPEAPDPEAPEPEAPEPWGGDQHWQNAKTIADLERFAPEPEGDGK